MHLPSLADYGYLGLFLWIFAEQVGLPIPALPILLAAGTLVSAGRMALIPSLFLILVASLAADLLWYYLGRAKGPAILHLVCRLSWKPNTCISTTKGVFTRYGAHTLLFAKFLPGLNTLAPPLAGAAGVTLRRFLCYDTAGALIWGLLPLLAGMGLKEFFPSREVLWNDLRLHLPAILGLFVLLFLVWSFVRRRRYVAALRRELEQGVTVDTLREMIDRGDDFVLLDIRHPLNFRYRPFLLPGAVRIGYHEIAKRVAELPLDRPLIAYCDCPGDQASFKVVQELQRLGAKSARVLKGGIEGWQSQGHPVLPAEPAQL